MTFSRDEIVTPEQRDEEGAGITMSDIGRALMIWVCMNHPRTMSVEAARLVFNTDVEIVRDAVREDQWAFLIPENEIDPRKQMIDVDGE